MRKLISHTANYFDPPVTAAWPNTIQPADLEPALTYVHVNRLKKDFGDFRRVFGILSPRPSRGTVEIYGSTVTRGGKQPEPGAIIPRTKVERKKLRDVPFDIDPAVTTTPAQTIAKVGRTVAVGMTDQAFVEDLKAKKRDELFTQMFSVATPTEAKQGTGLQGALAYSRSGARKYFEDISITPISFVSEDDWANYAATAPVPVSTPTVFGLTYVQNFLGTGTVVIHPRCPVGYVYTTAQENLNCAYLSNSGDLASTFGLTFDDMGLVGITHQIAADRASVDTLAITGLMFYMEDESGMVRSKIAGAEG